jgi:hypothetical protein
LPELIAAPPVYIVEGEGKADLLAKLGFVATSAGGGAEKWTADLNRWFVDRHVRILPDNDAPGRKHGQLVAKNLDGIAASVRLVELPGLPTKGDVKEWLQKDPTGARLVRICERASVWEPTVGATVKDEEAIAELAALSPLAYAKRRKGAAEAIGIGVGELDAIVTKARGEASVASRLPSRWEIERWNEAVDTRELLSVLRDTFARHVVLPDHGATAMALWTLHAWAFEAADISPFLVVRRRRCDAERAPRSRCSTAPALEPHSPATSRPRPSSATLKPIGRRSSSTRPTALCTATKSFAGSLTAATRGTPPSSSAAKAKTMNPRNSARGRRRRSR